MTEQEKAEAPRHKPKEGEREKESTTRRIKWLKLILSAVLTGIVSVLGAMIVFYWQSREPHLIYSITQSIPFAGENRIIGIYQVSIINDGKKEAEDVNCHVRIPGATIEQKRVSANPALTYSDSLDGDALKIHMPGLNPEEIVQLSILASAPSGLPTRPEVYLRARGVSGIEKPFEHAQLDEPSVEPATAGAIAAVASLFSGLVAAARRRRRK